MARPASRFSIIGLLLLAAPASAQTVVQARLTDAATHAPLPYASIVEDRTHSSVISNEEGVFKLLLSGANDTLTISYLGYDRLRIAGNDLVENPSVALRSSITELQPVEITGQLDPLYEVVVRCAKNLDRIGRYRSKLYYELSTRTADRPVEVMESFYNASFNGPAIEALELKNGRIGVAPDKGRYVMNLNTSKGFVLLDSTQRNGPFPSTPLEFGSRKTLHKYYDLTLLGITHDPVELYHIELTPRILDGNYFHAELWLEPATETIRSLELSCDSCARHPFHALYPSAQLRNMSLRYRQTYERVQGRSLLNTIELDYSLTYHSSRAGEMQLAATSPDFQEDRRMSTKGIMHVFDVGKQFVLPLFRYDMGQTDYRKISFMPYDAEFWAGAPGLVRTERQQQDLAFFAREGVLIGHQHSLLPDRKAGIFESNYAFWSPTTRIILKNSMPPAAYALPPVQRSLSAMPTAAQIQLVAQIYLNIDSVAGGGYRTFSTTVFDGFRSYHHLPEETNTRVFLNLFFDLCEMERRKMQAAIAEPGLSLKRIIALHSQAERNMERTTTSYMREVHYGDDLKALAVWNEKVRQALDIDNFKLLQMEPP